MPYQKSITTDFLRDDKEDGFNGLTLICPACGEDYHHVLPYPFNVNGNDSYEAGWGGRGDLYQVPIWGECGHVWALQMGFHKGQTFLFGSLLTQKKMDYNAAVEFVKGKGQS